MAWTDAASRVIAAPPDRVFAALVDPVVGISAEDHAAGMTSSLANLASYLER
ncbi:MAG: hypothetical protein Q8O56_05140 [Solirubrobacteraceae bacterium]|nr:hypothetical protein [Solirubrobacteraceae bacterium]